MKFDKLSLFADGITIPTTANTTTYSKVIDFRRCNLIDGFIKVYAQVVGTVNATGSVTTNLQVSADGTPSSWTSIASFTQDGMILAAAFLPILAKKRYARLAFAVGSTALGSAITVKAGLVDQFAVEEFPKPTVWSADGSGLVDLNNDAMSEVLVLGDASASATEGTAATIDYACKKGLVTDIVQSSDTSVTTTFANGVVEVKTTTATGDGSYSIGLVDGTGAKHTLTVVVNAVAG